MVMRQTSEILLLRNLLETKSKFVFGRALLALQYQGDTKRFKGASMSAKKSIVRDLRQRRGLSGGGLARKSGVDRSLIANIENLHRAPGIKSSEKLANVLGVEAGLLYGASQLQMIVRKAQDGE